MKLRVQPTLIIGAVMLTLPLLSAQTTIIPNANFENWTWVGIHEEPVDWEIRGDDSTGYSASKTVDSYAGTYAIKLQNILLPTDTIPGRASTKEGLDNPAFPWPYPSTRPSNLQGNYKFIPQNDDSCTISIFAFKTGFSSGILPDGILGYALYKLPPASTYSNFDIPINYLDPLLNPDSLNIDLAAFDMFDTQLMVDLEPLGNSELYVDNLRLVWPIGNLDQEDHQINQLYPNPVQNYLTVEMELEPAYYSFMLFDTQGKLVKVLDYGLRQGNVTEQFNLSDLHSGTYVFKVSSEKHVTTQKVIKIK